MKHWVIQLICAATVMVASGGASAQATTYTANVTSPYGSFSNFTPPCALGPCQNYAAATTPSGSFTTSAPLPANMAGSNIAGSLVSYSFSDGINTYSSADSDVRLHTMTVATDGTGAIVSSLVLVEKWLTGTAPHAAGNRFSFVQLNTSTISGTHNTVCTTLGVSPAGVADSCMAESPDASRSRGTNAFFTWSSISIAPANPASIPTTSEWGLVGMALLLCLAGCTAVRRRRH